MNSEGVRTVFTGLEPSTNVGQRAPFLKKLLVWRENRCMGPLLPKPPRVKKKFYIILFPICGRCFGKHNKNKLLAKWNFWNLYKIQSPILCNDEHQWIRKDSQIAGTISQHLPSISVLISAWNSHSVCRPEGSTGHIWTRADMQYNVSWVNRDDHGRRGWEVFKERNYFGPNPTCLPYFPQILPTPQIKGLFFSFSPIILI